MGPVCSTCYTNAIFHPGPCSTCHQIRVLVDRSPHGMALCGQCAIRVVADRSGVGHRGQLEYLCSSCGAVANYAASRCARCVLTDRVSDLLGGNGGTIPEQLLPFADALIHTPTPRQALTWLQRSTATSLLAELAAGTEPVHPRAAGPTAPPRQRWRGGLPS
jgi:hypothetical protein